MNSHKLKGRVTFTSIDYLFIKICLINKIWQKNLNMLKEFKIFLLTTYLYKQLEIRLLNSLFILLLLLFNLKLKKKTT